MTRRATVPAKQEEKATQQRTQLNPNKYRKLYGWSREANNGLPFSEFMFVFFIRHDG
jgi:hypothetical protein